MMIFLVEIGSEAGVVPPEKNDMRMDYIEYQNRYTDTYLGKYPMSYNGCAIIALYNLYAFSGRKIDNLEGFENLSYIRKWFNKVVYFGGKFGVMPWQVCKFMKQHGIKFKTDIVKTKNAKNYLAKNDGNVFIMMYAEQETAHYIFIDNFGEPHNTYGKTLIELMEKSPVKSCIVFNIQWIA